MKTITTKKLFTFIIMMMFSFTFVNAQCVCYCTPNGLPKYNAICYTKPNGNLGCRHDGGRPDCKIGNEASTPDAPYLEDIYPNPVSASTTIAFYVEQTQNVSLKIYDVSGRLVTTLADASFEEGGYEIIWNAADVKAGIYLLRMETASYSENWKLIVTK